jgi:type IV pilus assembly protein PilE
MPRAEVAMTSTFHRQAGFTLIEMMCAVAVAGVLSSVAYPGFSKVLHKARRSDAHVALMTLQMAQERYRSDHMAYGSIAELGVPAMTPSKHYTLSVEAITDSGFKAQAVASGAQAADTRCRHLQVTVDGLNVTHQSGSDATVDNGAEDNKRCWGL